MEGMSISLICDPLMGLELSRGLVVRVGVRVWVRGLWFGWVGGGD